jgi:hypothetical protein
VTRKLKDWEIKAQRDEGRRQQQTVTFRIKKLRDEYFVPVLISRNGGKFEASVCRCADQAAAYATRGGTRPLEYRGMFEERWDANGNRIEVEIEGDMSCGVSPEHWTWQYHGWTHGSLSRMSKSCVS